MTTKMVVAHPTTPVKQVAGLLAAQGLSALPVVDGRGRVVGVVSEADLLANSQLLADGRGGVTAGEVMTSPAVTVTPQATVTEAARRMQTSGVKRLPVVAGSGRLVGIVSRADLLRPLTRPDEEIRWAIEEMLGHELLIDPARVEVEVREGVVTLTGQVERRSLIPIVVRLTGAAEGVVRVQDWLTFELDDIGLQPSRSNRQRI
ncbi:MAG TPA: CBS domain-containing protein [Actinomycetes bacterium]|nr:CBS domain-containing protein [Actinomycetes bacterium]